MKTIVIASCCMLVALMLATNPVHAAIGYISGVTPDGTPTEILEFLSGENLEVSLMVYKYGVTDSPGRGGNINCFFRHWAVDDFGGPRSGQTDLAMNYAGDAGSDTPPNNDVYSLSFRGMDGQKYEYILFCRDLTDNTVAIADNSEFTFGRAAFYGPRSGAVAWFAEDFATFTGRGFETASNLSAGMLSSDFWRVGGGVEMDFGTTRTGGFFARGEFLNSILPGVYGLRVNDNTRAVVLQPSFDQTGGQKLFDPGFIELRLENSLESNILAGAHSVRIQYGWYAYGNSNRMQWQMGYRTSSEGTSTNDFFEYTTLGETMQTQVAPSQTSTDFFDFTINPNIPFRNYLFLRFNIQSVGASSGSPDASGLFYIRVLVNFNGTGPAPTTAQGMPTTSFVPSSSQSASSNGGAITTNPAASTSTSGTIVSASPAASSSANPATSAVISPSNNNNNNSGSSATTLSVALFGTGFIAFAVAINALL